jgi:DNA-binding response OmpR family regulator
MADPPKKPLGKILLQQRALTQDMLDKALSSGRTGGPPLATRLTESGAVSEVAALKALSEQSGVPGIDLKQVCLRLKDLATVPRDVAIKHKILPLVVRDDRIFVAMATPTDKKVIDELEFVTGKRVFPYVALEGPLAQAITTAYEMKERGETHYVGPNCPPEVLRKAGLSSTPRPQPAPEAPRDASIAEPLPPAGGPSENSSLSAIARFALRAAQGGTAVVIDDTLRRIAAGDEVSDADFGSTDRSVIADFRIMKDDRRTLLVVDDEDEIRKLLRTVFEERGYRVIEAARGDDALRLVKEQPPDAMILDAMLPGIHGFDIARRIKGSQRYGHIPIVIVSAVYRGWRYEADLKASYGIEAYIEKPFQVSSVLSAVEVALEQGRRRNDPAADANRISDEAERALAAGIAAYQAGDVDRAIAHLQEGTRIDPLAYRLHYHLGLLYGKRSQVYDAIQELETAVRINGRHFPALKNLAVLYQKAGFRNKAVETWERALQVAPDDATRSSIKEHLLGLLDT